MQHRRRSRETTKPPLQTPREARSRMPTEPKTPHQRTKLDQEHLPSFLAPVCPAGARPQGSRATPRYGALDPAPPPTPHHALTNPTPLEMSSRRDLLLSCCCCFRIVPRPCFFLVKPLQQELIRNSACKPNKNKALASEIIFRKVAY